MNWAELLVPLANVIYVVVAIVMTILILMQRGAGAQTGSSFGAGASGTVFGAQGSANFLSRSTAVCATLFFLISIGMGMYISHGGRAKPAEGGFMGGFQTAPANAEVPVAPSLPGATSSSNAVVPPPVDTAPVGTAPVGTIPAAQTSQVAPSVSTPAPSVVNAEIPAAAPIAPAVVAPAGVVPAESAPKPAEATPPQ